VADEQRPRDPEEEAGGPEALRQDPFVRRLRGDPSQPPPPVRVLEGLLGDSDRPGYHRIYFTREFDSYAEFRGEDVVYREPIPPDQPPFLGLDASRVGLRRDAPVWYTQVRTLRPVDEFDLDIRLGPSGGGRRAGALPIPPPETWEAECPGDTWGCSPVTFGCGTGRTDCVCPTDNTCRTDCNQATCNTCFATCNTCNTQCGQATCGATCQTCNTRCGQATCNTCNTRCGQATCATCRTKCNQATCDTCGLQCPTNNPHVFTCGPNPQC
jgi:hypothetical protein